MPENRQSLNKASFAGFGLSALFGLLWFLESRNFSSFGMVDAGAEGAKATGGDAKIYLTGLVVLSLGFLGFGIYNLAKSRSLAVREDDAA